MRQSSGAAVKNSPQAQLVAETYTGKPDDRCQERGCPYPSAAPGGWCRIHGAIRAGKIWRSWANAHTERNVTAGRFA